MKKKKKASSLSAAARTMSKAGASKGGYARAAKVSRAERKDSSRKGGLAKGRNKK